MTTPSAKADEKVMLVNSDGGTSADSGDEIDERRQPMVRDERRKHDSRQDIFAEP